jgi:hypothetical protein
MKDPAANVLRAVITSRMTADNVGVMCSTHSKRENRHGCPGYNCTTYSSAGSGMSSAAESPTYSGKSGVQRIPVAEPLHTN